MIAIDAPCFLESIADSAVSVPQVGAAAEPEEEPLPAGWAMGTAPNGRIFFINHNTRETSWVSVMLVIEQNIF